MLRRAACTAAALVAVATASSAAPPHLSDPKGDWHVPSQDVVSATLATDRAGRLVVGLRLAAPVAELPGYYHVILYRGCDVFVARLDWFGTAAPAQSSLETTRWCSGSIYPGLADVRPNPRTSVPATATVAGDTITWNLPAIPSVVKGTRIDGVAALVMPNPQQPVGFWSYTAGVPAGVQAFDIGYSDKAYVVGG